MPNCAKADFLGVCAECPKNSYLDQITFNCVEVPLDIRIENCLLYVSDSQCYKCEENYYYNDITCEAVPAVIPSCESYDSYDPTLCTRCAPGTVLSADKQSCPKVQQLENCALYSPLRCDKCKTGFVKDKNVFYEFLYDFFTSETTQKLSELMRKVEAQRFEGVAMRECKAITVTNCR